MIQILLSNGSVSDGSNRMITLHLAQVVKPNLNSCKGTFNISKYSTDE